MAPSDLYDDECEHDLDPCPDCLMGHIKNLVGQIDRLQPEADVLSGRACAEEQREGKGPCGICATCQRERIFDLEAALMHISEIVYDIDAQGSGIADLAQFAVTAVIGYAKAPATGYKKAREVLGRRCEQDQ